MIYTSPSETELRIINQLSHGLSITEISTETGLTTSAVDKMIKVMIERYQVRNDCHLMTIAFREGWME